MALNAHTVLCLRLTQRLLYISLHCMIICTHQVVDGEVVMLSAHWERRRGALLELQEQLQQIPNFLKELESITARVGETGTKKTTM